MMNAAANIPGLLTYANNNYKQQQRDRIMAVVPQVALAAADAYAGAATTLMPATESLQGALPIFSGVMGAGHALYGIIQVFPSDYGDKPKLDIARGVGHIITGAGFGALCAGLGVYALPIIALGEVTRVSATLIAREA
jgi:hypothetical protein